MTNSKNDFLPFALPDIGEEEITQVVESLRSGWLTTGPKAKQFEQDFAEFIGGNSYAVAVNSATSGLLLALKAFGIGEGDEVITTPYTFSATAMTIVNAGAKPVFVDIEKNSFNICPKKIEAAITEKTKAIMPVHFAGLSCDMDAIIDIAKRHNLRIIEDAAHALPATYNKEIIGNLKTDATVYSFYATKTITTGEGGMIIVHDEKIAKSCRIMRLHGISSDVFDRYTSTKPKWYYEITQQGYKCNMTDIAAAIGIPQLKKARAFQKRREQIKDIYFKELVDLPIILPEEPRDGDVHSWHLFVARLTDAAKISRDEFIEKMSSAYNIGCSVHFIPLNLHSFWQSHLGVAEGDFPVAVDSFNRAISLPIYTKMTDEDVHRVCLAIKELLS